MDDLDTSRPPIASVFITDALYARPAKAPDYLEEKRALQELAALMAERPDEVLPRYVDLAMRVTGGVSAGLSLLEPEPAPGVFRWRYLRGVLASFEGATTPRNFSPCGVTLDENRPVLSSHPERVYDWIAEARIAVPEVLLVPLYIGDATPMGTLWIVSGDEAHFDSGDARVMAELATFVGIALRMLRNEQRTQEALEAQETLTREMGHRVNNLIAMTEGMARITARTTTTKEEMIEVLTGRLHAMADAHALVRRNFGEARSMPRSSDLATLVKTVLKPHDTSRRDAPSRFRVTGPDVFCADKAMNGLALICHELATNAAKYGALTVDEGRVDVSWQVADGMLILQWTERGGPAIDNPPLTSGFGSTLAQNTITRQFSGTLDCDWQRGGLVVTITLPLDRLSV